MAATVLASNPVANPTAGSPVRQGLIGAFAA